MGKDRVRNILILLSMALMLTLAFSCTSDVSEEPSSASITFGEASRSITALVDGIDKASLYWKYASWKTLEAGEEEWIEVSGRTETYDENGAVFIHEDTPGLDGTVSGFAEGEWSFKLYGYRREGSGTEADPYKYNLVCKGESGTVDLKIGDVADVQVPVKPQTDPDLGNGTLFVDEENITFEPRSVSVSELGALTKTIKVTSLKDGVGLTGEDGVYSVVPGLYKVNVTYSYGSYRYADETVIATVYANLTTRVAGVATELTTSVLIDIP